MAQTIEGYEPASTLTGTEEIGIVKAGELAKSTSQDIANLGVPIERATIAIQVPIVGIFSANTPIAMGNIDYSGTPTNFLWRSIYIAKTGTITTASITLRTATVAIGATPWSMYIRVNDTTDYLIETVTAGGVDSQTRNWRSNSLSIPVVAGDFIVVKSDNPATVPSSPHFSGYITIDS